MLFAEHDGWEFWDQRCCNGTIFASEGGLYSPNGIMVDLSDEGLEINCIDGYTSWLCISRHVINTLLEREKVPIKTHDHD